MADYIAKIIRHSVGANNPPIATFKLRYPRFIHAEFMTHRMISRNASGSRAIPTAKLIAEVTNDELRAEPIFWGKNQKGMQAAEELVGWEQMRSRELWKFAAHAAASYAGQMADIGAHKQIVNRILEPFLHINVIATATEWDNFFGLRLHKDAQQEIRALAGQMYEELKASTPKLLKPGEWHLPLFEEEDEGPGYVNWSTQPLNYTPIHISVARCARVSYQSHETGKRSTLDEDINLYDRLITSSPIHASPAEHQATPDECSPYLKWWGHAGEHGNFKGWRQFRKFLPGEDRAPLPEGFR